MACLFAARRWHGLEMVHAFVSRLFIFHERNCWKGSHFRRIKYVRSAYRIRSLTGDAARECFGCCIFYFLILSHRIPDLFYCRKIANLCSFAIISFLRHYCSIYCISGGLCLDGTQKKVYVVHTRNEPSFVLWAAGSMQHVSGRQAFSQVNTKLFRPTLPTTKTGVPSIYRRICFLCLLPFGCVLSLFFRHLETGLSHSFVPCQQIKSASSFRTLWILYDDIFFLHVIITCFEVAAASVTAAIVSFRKKGL